MNIDKLNLESLLDVSRQDLRDILGLTPRFRDYAWPALGVLSAGVVLGAGAALLLAPKSGQQLRADISDEFRARLDAVESRLRDLVPSERGEADDEPDTNADTDGEDNNSHADVEVKAA